VPLAFWRRDDVRLALARREVGRLFAIYLGAYEACTQTQLGLITEHDRSDISNFVRGTRSPRVTDIDVLGRIADGLLMPDEARTLLGLAPADTPISVVRSGPRPSATTVVEPAQGTTGWYRPIGATRPLRVAICGSRSARTNDVAMDEAVCALGRLFMNHRYEVDHGPVGIGMEVMTYIADHYRPPDLEAAVGVFGRPNVVRRADFVLIVGGGTGTLDEMDLALSMGKRIIPFAATGGTAQRALERMSAEIGLRAWMSDDVFTALGLCATADAFVKIVEQIFATESGSGASD
jgi:hypothetical protein